MAHINQQSPFEDDEEFLAKFEQKAKGRRLDLNALLRSRLSTEPLKEIGEKPHTDTIWTSLSKEQKPLLLSRHQHEWIWPLFPKSK